VDRVGDHRRHDVGDVQELEAREERVPLVDLGVAHVEVAVGVELLAHHVELVLPADEVRLDPVTHPQRMLARARPVGGNADHVAAGDEITDHGSSDRPRRFAELHRPVDVEAHHDA
jgi:hypothetical protein